VLSSPRPRMFGHWAIHKSRMYFIALSERDAPKSSELWLQDLATRETRKLADLPGAVPLADPGLAISPDGRSLLYPRIDSTSSDLYLMDNYR